RSIVDDDAAGLDAGLDLQAGRTHQRLVVVAADRPLAGLDAGLDLQAAGTHRRLVVVDGGRPIAGLDIGLHVHDTISCCTELASAAQVTGPPPRWPGGDAAGRACTSPPVF